MLFAVGYTQAYHELWPTPPPTSLVALTPILSLIMQVCVMAVALVVVNQMTISQPWFVAVALFIATIEISNRAIIASLCPCVSWWYKLYGACTDLAYVC